MQNVGEIKVVLKGKKESAFTLVGAANQQLAILENSMKLGGLVTASRQLNYSNGAKIVATITQGFKTVEIFFPEFEEVKKEEELEIEIPPAGFFCHIMTDDFPTGMQLDKSAVVTGPYTYPLVDGDHGTFFIKMTGKRDTPEWVVLRPLPASENYGNVDFVCGPRVFSIRGPSGRQIPLNPLVSYTGFTALEEVLTTIEGDVSYYTPFSKDIYFRGKTSLVVPVVGVTAVKVLAITTVVGVPVIIIGTNYRGVANPDETTGGFYTEVWKKVETWVRIGYTADSRHVQPWCFSKNGIEAVCELSKLVISDDLTSVVFSVLAGGSGLQTNNYGSISTGIWGTSQTGNWKALSAYSVYDLKQLQIVVTSIEGSSRTAVSEDTTEDLATKYSGYITISGVFPEIGTTYTVENACGALTFSCSCATINSSGVVTALGSYCCDSADVTVTDSKGRTATITVERAEGLPITISGTDTPTVGSTYSVEGGGSGATPYAWGFSGGTISSSGEITSITGCGPGTVTVTDICGRSAEKDVRLPSGVWSVVFTKLSIQCSCGSYCYSTLYTGITRYTTRVQCCLGSETSCVAQYSAADQSITAPGSCPEWWNVDCEANSGGTWHVYFTYKEISIWVCP